MDSELLTVLLLAACAVGFGVGALWQIVRRKPQAARKLERRIERIERVGPRRAAPAPGSAEAAKAAARAAAAAVAAAERPAAPDASARIGTMRPMTLAITPVSGDLTAAEVFVSRALEINEPHYRDLKADPVQVRGIQCLFDHAPCLAWEPGCEYSSRIYEVAFSPVIDAALSAGFNPRANATASDLQIMAIDEHGQELGEPMATPDYSWGAPARVYKLWTLLNPAEHEHALAAELRAEIDAVDKILPRVKLFVPAVEGLSWQKEFEALRDLANDAMRLGLEEGRAQARTARADELAAVMRAHNRAIDEKLAALLAGMKTPEDASAALKAAVPLMTERKLAVMVLRAIALVRVIASDDYVHGMRCSSKIAQNVEEFPNVHPLLETARRIALDAAASKARALRPDELERLGGIRREAARLAEAHDGVVAQLKADVSRLQSAIDSHLIVQSLPRRHAVRLNEEGRVEALLVLEH